MELDRILKHSQQIVVDDLDWELAARAGLTASERRVLTYFADIEAQTIVYLRDLLRTEAALEPEVMGFLQHLELRGILPRTRALAAACRVRLRSGEGPRRARARRGPAGRGDPGAARSLHFPAERLALSCLWAPVGAAVKGTAESARVMAALFPGDRAERVARELDRRMGDLPGLAGVSLLGAFLERTLPAALAGA